MRQLKAYLVLRGAVSSVTLHFRMCLDVHTPVVALPRLSLSAEVELVVAKGADVVGTFRGAAGERGEWFDVFAPLNGGMLRYGDCRVSTWFFVH